MPHVLLSPQPVLHRFDLGKSMMAHAEELEKSYFQLGDFVKKHTKDIPLSNAHFPTHIFLACFCRVVFTRHRNFLILLIDQDQFQNHPWPTPKVHHNFV